MKRVTINKLEMDKELNDHWEILAEAVQTILRKAGQLDAYEKLKSFTRGQSINVEELSKHINELNISPEDKILSSGDMFNSLICFDNSSTLILCPRVKLFNFSYASNWPAFLSIVCTASANISQ